MHATEEPKHACKLTKQLRHDCIYNPVPRTLHREDTFGRVGRHLRNDRYSHRKNNKNAWQTCLQNLDTPKKAGATNCERRSHDPGHSICNSAINAKVAIAGSRRTNFGLPSPPCVRHRVALPRSRLGLPRGAIPSPPFAAINAF